MQRAWRFRAAGPAVVLLALLMVAAAPPAAKPPYSAWSDYGGSPDSMQYSALKSINKSNVNQLQRAWFYPAPGPSGRFAFNPLVVDDVMYLVGADSNIVALDAATGKQLWARAIEGNPTNRG